MRALVRALALSLCCVAIALPVAAQITSIAPAPPVTSIPPGRPVTSIPGRVPDAIDGVRERSMAPIPRAPETPASAERWVPERRFYSSELGREIVVPGHYERRITDQQYAVPPLTGYGPLGERPVFIPGGQPPTGRPAPGSLRTPMLEAVGMNEINKIFAVHRRHRHPPRARGDPARHRQGPGAPPAERQARDHRRRRDALRRVARRACPT